MLLLTTLLGLVAVSGAAATTSYLVLGSGQDHSPGLRTAQQACLVEPSCVEWRIEARCESRSLIGRLRVRKRTLHTYGRSPQEAAWMVTHFEQGCVVARVEQPGEIPAGNRACKYPPAKPGALGLEPPVAVEGVADAAPELDTV